MKNLALPMLALMAGLILGAWGPRSDLRSVRQELTKLKAEMRREQISQPFVSDVKSMLGVGSGKGAGFDRPQTTRGSANNSSLSETPAPVESSDNISAMQTPGAESLDATQAFEAAKDLWKARSAHAKQSLIEKLNLTEEEVAQFDGMVDRMNEALGEKIKDTVDLIKNQEDLTPEDGIRFLNGVSGVLLNTYEDADEFFPSNWREDTTEETDLINFIDPEVALPLLDLETEMAPSAEMEDAEDIS